jgi:hypothetical protein
MLLDTLGPTDEHDDDDDDDDDDEFDALSMTSHLSEVTESEGEEGGSSAANDRQSNSVPGRSMLEGSPLLEPRQREARPSTRSTRRDPSAFETVGARVRRRRAREAGDGEKH